MKKILIFGDSFAADWSRKYSEYKGWPTMLAEKFDVTNIAQAGVSEYKIYKQLLSVKNLNDFDYVIVSHTSPYRVPVRKHPIHQHDILHKDADLIEADINYHAHKFTNILNISLRTAKNFFLHLYDEEYYTMTYDLFREKIDQLLSHKKVITVNNFHNKYTYLSETYLDFSHLYDDHRGLINHFSEYGNQVIFQKILCEIN
jgi:hypothetical protein